MVSVFVLAVTSAVLAVPGRAPTHAAAGAFWDGSSWPVPGHDAQATNFNPAERIIGPATAPHLHSVWAARYVYQAVATATRVYAITREPSGTRLLDLDVRSGRLVRAFTPDQLHVRGYPGSVQDTWFQSLAYGQGRLVVGTTNEVLAVDPETARVHWRVRGGAFWLTVEGGTVYTSKPRCQNPCGVAVDSAIDIHTGRVLWSRPNHGGGAPLLVAGRLLQQFLSIGIGPAGPALLYDPRSGRLLRTLSLGSERVYWTGDTSSLYVMGSSSPYSTGSSNGTRCSSWVRRLTPSGSTLWNLCMDPRSLFMAPPVVAYRTLYAATERSASPPGSHGGGPPPTLSGSVVAISADTGRILWRSTQWHYPHGVSPDFVGMVGTNHLLFIETRGPGQVTVLDTGTGRLIRRFPAPGYWGQPDSWPLLIAGGTLFAGHLIAYRP